MKRLIAILTIVSLMTTACTRDDSEWSSNGSESLVTFSARLPQQFQTRSFGDGLTATKLTYAVYGAGETTPLQQVKAQAPQPLSLKTCRPTYRCV